MERDFYIHIDRFGEEHIIEERTSDEIIKELKILEQGNDFKIIWHLVDSMKSNYEKGNDEIAEFYYNTIISVIKNNLTSE